LKSFGLRRRERKILLWIGLIIIVISLLKFRASWW